MEKFSIVLLMIALSGCCKVSDYDKYQIIRDHEHEVKQKNLKQMHEDRQLEIKIEDAVSKAIKKYDGEKKANALLNNSLGKHIELNKYLLQVPVKPQ